MGYGMTRRDLKKAAVEYALSNDLNVPEKWKKTGYAGDEWLKLFRRRHDDISLGQPEACSLARESNRIRDEEKCGDAV